MAAAGVPMDLPGPAAADLSCVRLEFPDDSAEAPEDLAAIASLASSSLAPEERDAWEALRSPRRRREWLMGRLAAKDAVRRHLESAGGGVGIGREAIAILADAWGRPHVAGPPIAIAIAHTRGVAAAVAGATRDGLGLDIERLDRRRGDYERAAFSDEERRRLEAGPAQERAARALRLFCAKEAVAKAIGRGLMGSPLNLRLAASDEDVTRADLEIAGRLERELPALRNRRLTAWIDERDGLIVAVARCAEPPGRRG
jgi:phosphopantetheinyl transferase